MHQMAALQNEQKFNCLCGCRLLYHCYVDTRIQIVHKIHRQICICSIYFERKPAKYDKPQEIVDRKLTRFPFFGSFYHFLSVADKKLSGKSKDEQMAEKKQELEKRLQDVTGQLGSAKKTKKGKYAPHTNSGNSIPTLCVRAILIETIKRSIFFRGF